MAERDEPVLTETWKKDGPKERRRAIDAIEVTGKLVDGCSIDLDGGHVDITLSFHGTGRQHQIRMHPEDAEALVEDLRGVLENIRKEAASWKSDD